MMRRRALFSRVTRAAALIALALAGACRRSSSATPRVWHATGVIKSFGPARAFVNIAHEEIPGYMMAMTMSFEPQRPALLDGFAVGDRVAFDFFETEDARRVLTHVERGR